MTTKKRTLKMKQLIIAPFSIAKTKVVTYSTLGLEEDGSVWRFDPACQGWIPYNMTVADCKAHKR